MQYKHKTDGWLADAYQIMTIHPPGESGTVYIIIDRPEDYLITLEQHEFNQVNPQAGDYWVIPEFKPEFIEAMKNMAVHVDDKAKNIYRKRGKPIPVTDPLEHFDHHMENYKRTEGFDAFVIKKEIFTQQYEKVV